eukprot:gnl/Chilomastix_caulleri/784.p1 GENE.gnl/Chilomastix_caulleri/784~~gnl/Chilomastix_caulleri/784.p1  ORF type:complete len:100 (+),score=19.18 gnl/Chilomastix_caulleri/784:382-681(+)
MLKLITFLQRLKGEMITIEMKDNTVAMGIMNKIDRAMNVVLSNAKSVNNITGVPERSDFLTIRGNTIRQILLPDAINLDVLLMDKPMRIAKPSRKKAPN